MKRRDFLKTGIGMGSAILLNNNPVNLFSKYQENDFHKSSYSVGEQISPDAFVLDKELKPLTLLGLCKKSSAAKVILLYIYGGGMIKHQNRLGGIWCPDTFEDLHILRFTYYKYKKAQVHFIPVACPPVYSSQYYGFEKRVFLDEAENSKKYKENAKAFVAKTEEIVESGLIPTETFYDLRFRLLFNWSKKWKPGKGYGTIYSWQGKFRDHEENQKYGTPTLWLLNSEGIILNKPFSGNIYHSEPFRINYTVSDVDKAIERHL